MYLRFLILILPTLSAFASTYPGAGGCSHKAGVKIEPGKRSDQAYGAARTGMAQKNELYIRDLGYFRLQEL